MNPFDITKAVDYSDEELFNNWVDFPSTSFQDLIRPTLEMPMIIVGSKGSGKTHIMKHFSFSMQKLRCENSYEGILKENYIGIYLRCSGLNGYRFTGRNEKDETWEVVFAYYLDLWLSQIFLSQIIDLITLNVNIKKHESEICRKILKVFSKEVEISTLHELQQYLHSLQKNIDYVINNISLNNKSIKSQIEILSNPGELIFEIPNIITKAIPDLRDMKILFLLDEYENFSISQQKYFNTLIRERKNPVCFKIGSRRYGIKTKQTLSANEHIKVGSEYELFDLDHIFQHKESNYKEFVKEICEKRIINSGLKLNFDISENFYYANYQSDFIKMRNKNGHIDKFISKLQKSKIDNINEIVKNISCDDLLIERLNIYIIYRGIKKRENLLVISKQLKEFSELHSEGKRVTNYDVILDKFKQDIIDALYRENSLKLTSYCGFDNLIKISNGIPRHFLMIMKHIFRWNSFYESNFSIQKVSTDIQLLAIKDTVLWFMEDANQTNEYTNFKYCIENLCDFLRELRFSDLPPECSISTFQIENMDFRNDLNQIIKFLEQYSYIIKLDYGRRDKNSNQRSDMYQINGLLSCWWELSISRRGIVKIPNDNLEKLFYYSKKEELKEFKITELIKYNIPFKNSNKLPSLFE